MPVSKCVNCGANIPSGAAFCPSCGAQKAVEQPMPQPTQPAYYPTQADPMDNLFDKLFSTKLILLGILLGLLLVFIGNLMFNFIYPPTTGDLTGIRVASALESFGFFAMGAFLIGGGIANKNLEKYVRLAMVLGGIWLAVSGLAVSYPGIVTSALGRLV